MAIRVATRFRIIAGKNQEFLSQVAEGRKIHERVGGKVRVWQATLTGESTGNIAYIIEHNDISAYADFTQKLQGDAEWQAFVAKITDNPTATILSQGMANEITS